MTFDLAGETGESEKEFKCQTKTNMNVAVVALMLIWFMVGEVNGIVWNVLQNKYSKGS